MPYRIDQVKRHFELHNEQQDHYEDEYNVISHVSLYYSIQIQELVFENSGNKFYLKC